MEIINLINFIEPGSSNFIVKIILWLVSITSSVVAGIVLFTLLLKLITLPFDFFSRASMRKNSLKMEEMRPELERLQKQYANDKNLYNQKMMALYKKNGYSMFGSCLPTIITLVIFIVAISGFSEYSYYQNQKYFYDMSVSYNTAIYSEFIKDNEDLYIGEDKVIYIEDNKLIVKDDIIYNYTNPIPEVTVKKDKETITTDSGTIEQNYYTVQFNNSDVVYKRYVSTEGGNTVFNQISFYTTSEEIKNSVIEKAQEKSAETYRNSDKTFLWVKNVWITDSPFKRPIEENFENFKASYRANNCGINANDYNNLTAKLTEEKGQVNGYFILVLLTAGTSLLLQLITSKSNKAQMELQTVDGQGAQTQKLMTYMMPIMMAIFSFMYTAAFSIYITLSSLISIGTTFGINAIVDLKYGKKKGEAEITHSRIYVPKVEEKEKPKKETKTQKQINEDGFLSGRADRPSPKKK